MSGQVKSIAGFELEKVLGKGGMGAVYQAIHPRTGAQVAIKVILKNLQEREEVQERFRREVRAMTLVEHPNLVRILEAGEADGHSYYVMQLVDGVDLSTYTQRKGPMKVNVLMNVATGVFSALAALHEAGVLHRDLKPHNVMLDRSGQPLIMDLGLTRVRDMKTMTRTGALIGSPRYMPPELLEGKPLDARSDLYQAGLILWECATGEVAATGENFQEVSTRILTGDIPPVLSKRPDIPPTLANVIEICLEVNPDHRVESGQQALDLLEGRTTLDTLRQDLEASAAERAVIARKAAVQGPAKHRQAQAPQLPAPPPLSSILRTRVLPIFLFLLCLFLGFHFSKDPPLVDPVELQVRQGLDRIEVSWKDAPGTRIQMVVKNEAGDTWTTPEGTPRIIPALADGRCRLIQEGLPPDTRFEVYLAYADRRTLPRSFSTPPALLREGSPRLGSTPEGKPGLLIDLHIEADLRVGYPRSGSGVSWIESPSQTNHVLTVPDIDLFREGASIHVRAHDAAGGQVQTSVPLVDLLRRSGQALIQSARLARSVRLKEELLPLLKQGPDKPKVRELAEELLSQADLERPVSEFLPVAAAFFQSREIESESRLAVFQAIEDLRLVEQAFLLLKLHPTPSPAQLLQGSYHFGDRGVWRDSPPILVDQKLVTEGLPLMGDKVHHLIELSLPEAQTPSERIRLTLRVRQHSPQEGAFLQLEIPGGPSFREYLSSPTRSDREALFFVRELDLRDLPRRKPKLKARLDGVLRAPYDVVEISHFWVQIPAD